MRLHMDQWAKYEEGVVFQRKIEVFSPEEGRWMLGMEKRYISTMEANHSAEMVRLFFFLKFLASLASIYSEDQGKRQM